MPAVTPRAGSAPRRFRGGSRSRPSRFARSPPAARPVVSRRRLLGAGLAAVLVSPLLAACGSSSGGVPTLNWYIGKQSGGWIENAIATCNKQAAGKYQIKFQELPSEATDQREQLVRRLAANDSSIDIVGMDVIWTAEFANAKWVEPFPESQRAALTDGVLQGPVKSGTYQGKLYAAPFTSNTQLLWYRKDLVPAPPPDFTWQQMIDEATKVGKSIQIQGARAESLNVTFNSLLESAGGHFLDNADAGKNATVSLAQAPTEAALTVLHNLATSSASNPSLNTADEDASRQAFEKGNSVYEINYPFIYPSAAESTSVPDLQKKIGWARFPRVYANVPSKPPLGGFNLSAASSSKHKDLDFQAIQCIRQPANQLFAAEQGGNPPTSSSVYNQLTPDKYPFKDVLEQSINDAAPRPVSPAYNDLSLAVQNTIHPLSSISPSPDATKLRNLSQQALKSEAVLS